MIDSLSLHPSHSLGVIGQCIYDGSANLTRTDLNQTDDN
jgi:hypothetical protein